MAGWLKVSLGTQVGLGPGDIMLDGDPAPLHGKGHSNNPHFSASGYCGGQMAGLMKIPLGKEVDLGPGQIVLDGEPAPAKGARQPRYFGPMSTVVRMPTSKWN